MQSERTELVDAFRMAQEYLHGFKLGEIAEARGLTIPAARKAIERTGTRVRRKDDEKVLHVRRCF